MSTVIKKITPDDEVFNSPKFLSDRLIFNYIYSARGCDNTEFYSDCQNVIICRKEGNRRVWIWTSDEIRDDIDSFVSIAKAVRELDTPNLEFFIKPEVSQKFSDMYALVSCDLDYQIKSEFSLGVYRFSGEKLDCDDSITVQKYNKKFASALLQFYMNFKDEFSWSEEKVKRQVKKYCELNTYLLLKNGEIISVCVIRDDIGDCCSVRSVVTKTAERNNGYAALLTNIAASACQKNKKIMLYANNGNLSAVSAFKKAGFTLIGNVHLIKS